MINKIGIDVVKERIVSLIVIKIVLGISSVLGFLLLYNLFVNGLISSIVNVLNKKNKVGLVRLVFLLYNIMNLISLL